MQFLDLIQKELATDQADCDVTTRLLGRRAELQAKAVMVAREKGVFATHSLKDAFRHLTPIEISLSIGEGDSFEENAYLAELQGPLGVLLQVERTFINCFSFAAGVATLTRRYVEAVKSTPAKILCTRKTLPGLRELSHLAVLAGGGHVHRRSLADGILIKENHLTYLSESEILQHAQKNRAPLHGVEIEVQSIDRLPAVLKNPPDVIMLDNLSLLDIKLALKEIDGKIKVEVSGGVTLENVRPIAELGVDYISVGRLTHSAPSLNLSFDFKK